MPFFNQKLSTHPPSEMTSTKKYGFSLASIMTLVLGAIAVALWTNDMLSTPRIYLVPAVRALVFYAMAAVTFMSALLSFIALLRRESGIWTFASVALWAFPVIFVSIKQRFF